MTDRFPDLEIYLMKAEADVVFNWLSSEIPSLQNLGKKGDGDHWQAQTELGLMDVYFNPNAEKNFASLWFKQNHTPWKTDLACARSAHKTLNIEIRCSDSGWSESEEETEQGWIKLIRGEEKAFFWK